VINFFKPEDFSYGWANQKILVELAEHANKLLEEKCIRVVGLESSEDLHWSMGTESSLEDTHESLMLPPWEIKKCPERCKECGKEK